MSTIRPRASDELPQVRAIVDNIPALIAIHNQSGELELEAGPLRNTTASALAETKQWQTR